MKLYGKKYSKMDLNENELIDILSNNPILMERPIVEFKDFGVLARPIENLFEFHQNVGK